MCSAELSGPLWDPGLVGVALFVVHRSAVLLTFRSFLLPVQATTTSRLHPVAVPLYLVQKSISILVFAFLGVLVRDATLKIVVCAPTREDSEPLYSIATGPRVHGK